MSAITTDIDGLLFRDLEPRELDAYFHLVDCNRAHLARASATTPRCWTATTSPSAAHLAEPATDGSRFGLWYDHQLIGRVDLNPIDPPNFVLGYWIDARHTGRGFVTAACRSLIAWAATELPITDLWAGVTHGNDRSVAVLRRLGFQHVEDFDHYSRYHLTYAAHRDRADYPTGYHPGTLEIAL